MPGPVTSGSNGGGLKEESSSTAGASVGVPVCPLLYISVTAPAEPKAKPPKPPKAAASLMIWKNCSGSKTLDSSDKCLAHSAKASCVPSVTASTPTLSITLERDLTKRSLTSAFACRDGALPSMAFVSLD